MGKGEQLIEVFTVLLVFGQIFDELDAFTGDVLHILKIGCSEVLANEFDLILGISSRQKWLSLEHLSKDAADAPHID